jgi:transcriptional regulator with XRE-family HTH domain
MNTISSFAAEVTTMAASRILIQFGDNVRKYRKLKGFSQEGLAHECGLHRTYIGMIERAEKNITLINVEKIAKALNVDIKKLVDGTK